MQPVDAVQAFRGLRVLVIGDAMLDTYYEGTATRLCREGPVPVVSRTGEEHVPGGAANSAANLKALGAEVSLLSVVGSDVPGWLLRDTLRARGVDDRWIVEDEAAGTLHKLRILANEQYVVRFDSGDTRALSPATQRRCVELLEELLPLCDVVVVSDYGYGVASDDLLDRLRSLRAEHRCPLLVDAKNLRRFTSIGATVVTPNAAEAQAAVDPTGGSADPADGPQMEGVGRRLLELIDAEHAAITLAGDGVLVMSRDGSVHIPAHSVARANDVGAGDSFAAAMALALGAGADVHTAARIGIDAGGIAVTKRRTAVVHHQELLQRVSLMDEDTPPALDALTAQLAVERMQGRTIVFTNGVFDILHAGHVHFLRRARTLGDVLVVGINTDASARRLKGKNRPINGERDRMALVSALDPVDHVVSFDGDTPADLIRIIRPDIHVKGGDYAGEALPEAEAVEEVGGRVVILPLHEDLSTTTMIERIVALSSAGIAGAAK